jgi:dephospho-CoA kinase
MLFNFDCSIVRKYKKGCLMNAEKLVVGLAGMPGSGKSIVVETAVEMGYSVIVMGDVIRQETQLRGLNLDPQSIGRVMLELRNNGGAGVVAYRCIPRIEKLESRRIIVDGLRSLSEVDVFKKRFPNFSLIAVYASPETRFDRIYRRRRSDDPTDWNLFHERDMRELCVGLGNVIAMAEYLVINENNQGKNNLRTVVKKFLGRIEAKWIK